MTIPPNIAYDRLQGIVVPSIPSTHVRPAKKSEKRPAHPYVPGMTVAMRPIPGLTPKGVFEDGKAFVFQASPIEVLGEDGAYQWNDYNTVGAGQHSSAIGRQLNTISFDTIFLDWQPVWTVVRHTNWAPNPRKMVDELKAIKDSGRPFLLLASQADSAGYDVNYAATLRSVHWELRAGEVDAYYVTVGFTEFTSPDIQSYIAGSTSTKLPVSIPISQVEASNATLASLAKQYYGDPSKASVIQAANAMPNVPVNTPITAKVTSKTKITIPRLPSTGSAGKSH